MIYIVVVVFSLTLTFSMRSIARKRAILDIPNHRSAHSTATPRGGGLAIVIAFYSGLLWFWYVSRIDFSTFLLYLSALPIALVGLLDDILDLSSLSRLLIQLVCAAVAVYMLHIPWYAAPFAILLIVWFTNLCNFLDGSDGYLVLEIVFVSIAAYLLFRDGIFLLMFAATLGFLPYNWQRASIFMGDVGSTFIGFVLGIWILQFSCGFSDLFLWAYITLPFWFDATYTLMRRWFNGEKITQPHNKHLFQRAIQSGLQHYQVALGLFIINSLFFIAVWLYKDGLIIFFVCYLLFLFALAHIIEKRVPFAR